jgi:hypothetical protein
MNGKQRIFAKKGKKTNLKVIQRILAKKGLKRTESTKALSFLNTTKASSKKEKKTKTK